MICEIYNESQELYFSHTSYLKCLTLNGGSRSPYSVTFSSGKFKIEVWGASGGDTYGPNGNSRTNQGGFGGYLSGIIKLNNTTTFSFYIGTKGDDGKHEQFGNGGYNGGANGGNDPVSHNCASGGGGGATDMRYSTDLDSRIIVAGGGGSGGCYKKGGKGGDGGGLYGLPGKPRDGGTSPGGEGGTQESGASLGNGASGSNGDEVGGSGGGGYYGGKGAPSTNDASGSGGGGGGSSYISGFPGCLSNQFYQFQNAFTISGGNKMPSKDDLNSFIDEGNHGNGAVRITTVKNDVNIKECKDNNYKLLYVFIILL